MLNSTLAKLSMATVGTAVLTLGVGEAARSSTLTGDQVDIRTELGFSTFGGARVFEVDGATVGSGAELTLADELENPSSFVGAVDVDIDGLLSQITVSVSETFSTGVADFEFVNIFVEDLDFSPNTSLTGISLVSDNLLDLTRSDPFTLSFDALADSVSISWATAPFSALEIKEGGQAVFQLETADTEPTSVPEPASLLGLLAVGAFGAGSALKRKQKA